MVGVATSLVLGLLHARLFGLLGLLGLFALTQFTAQASPVWMPQFLSGGSGRNMRHLPCVSRRTGEQGTCMFAYTCIKANGTHLGTCIDRFYFGSCCKLEHDQDPLLENDFNYPSLSNKVTDNDPLMHPSVSTIVDAVKLGTSISNAVRPTTQPPSTISINTTDKIYVPISTSHKNPKPNKTDISGDAMKKPDTLTLLNVTTTQRPSTTTPQYLLSTFQVVHDNNNPTTAITPTFEATTRLATVQTTVRTTTTTTTRRPVSSTSKPVITTKKPTKVPTKTTTKKPPTKKPTVKPTPKPTTKPVKATTSKPSASTVSKKPTTASATSVTVTTVRPTVTSTVFKPLSTVTNKPVKPVTSARPTVRPTTTTKKTSTTTPSTTLAILSTTSEVVFTKPGSDILTTNFSVFSTFRPDLSPTTKSPVITGPGLTTFTYLPERVTTEAISNDVTTGKTPSSENEVASEEQSNLIFQQAGTPATSTSAESIIIATTKTPWVEIAALKPDSSSGEATQVMEGDGLSTSGGVTTVKLTTTTEAGDTSSSSSGTTELPATTIGSNFAPSFGNLNVSDYTQVCGRRLYPESRVVGGEKATFGKWPWQISLRQWRTSTYLHKCGAALLNENWAITAAHCVENVPPSDLLLRLGEHDLSREDEPYGYQERRVQIVASHPQFDPRTFEYDLALLRFYEPVKFQPNIIPICVPEDSTNFVGQDAHVTGWGRLYEDGPLPSVLQEVSVPVINNTICENMYRTAGYIEHIPDIFICAGWKKGGFDSCEGDSGGPMVIQRPDKRWLLAGVISWGIGCAEPNQPGVYTRISQFRDWINQILQF